ncbi:MAG: ribonucleotide-diphosphate reductase subunit beta [Candidatus Cloacimonadota bacterium]|nr:MAG: ribonucleotide-diphosphate reductase subunit beta [Candidatus Cloacimonadota bacterium]
MLMKKNKLFNPDGDKDFGKRRLIGGNSTNLFELNNIKYDWAMPIYRGMMNNFWIPEEIPLGNDAKDYKLLSDAEQRAYDKVLSFLVFLDSLQTANLPNFSAYVTAPEVNLCLAVQTFQEAVHSQSYGYILDTVVSASKRELIYNYWREDEFLMKRNMVITRSYEDFTNEPSERNFVLGMMANYILEGIYFYSGFSFFYVLARQEKMCGTAQEIRYIQRDELTHLVLFQNMINTLRKENSELFTDEVKQEMIDLMKSAVQNEIEWGQYIIRDGILGLTDELIERYIKYLANRRMGSIGFAPLYPDITKNPMEWVDSFSSVNKLKTDFFEAKPTAYSKASNLDWDDLD